METPPATPTHILGPLAESLRTAYDVLKVMLRWFRVWGFKTDAYIHDFRCCLRPARGPKALPSKVRRDPS